MSSLIRDNLDVFCWIVGYLSFHDSVSFSSTSSQLRRLLCPSLFSVYHWDRTNIPPKTVRCYIRHLYLHVFDHDEDALNHFFDDFDADRLWSLHLCAENIMYRVRDILPTATQLQTLDLARLCYKTINYLGSRDYTPYKPLPAFPTLSCQPRVLQFCSRFDEIYDARLCANRMRATRFSFATLLAQLDVSQIERVEVGAEALSLPIAAAYTWAALRELVITGCWLHPQDDPGAFEDPGSGTPASIFAHVHIGTLLVAAPRLSVLRVRCRYTPTFPQPCCVVWPRDDNTAARLGTALRALDTFELYNPTATDGIYAHLPPTLRALSLLAYPHCTTKVDEHPALPTGIIIASPPQRVLLAPVELMRILSVTALPDLRDLRLSFRDLADMRLCEFIAKAFPRLELLELHAEAGARVPWQAPELSACASALAPLLRLQTLRLNTFRSALTVEAWRQSQARDPAEAPEQRARAGIALPDIVRALSGRVDGSGSWGTGDAPPAGERHAEDTGPAGERHAGERYAGERHAGERHADGGCRWPALREVWLPQSRREVGRWDAATWYREWGVYSVRRDEDGFVDLHKSGPNVPIEQDDLKTWGS